ncbi:MAG: glycosyltransferase family 1 protein [Planctomycetota bacterium]|nr:MAG: glycosyltransferase family 1 protein [Planctomycetota bacterium]
MKVLMLGWEFPPHLSGGLGTACQGLSRALTGQGLELCFLLPRLHGDESSPGVSFCDVPADSEGEAVAEIVAVASPLRPYADRWVEPPVAKRGPLAGGYGPDLMAEVTAFADRSAKAVEQETFDLVHAHDWMTWPAALHLRRHRGVPFVAHVHSCEFDRNGDRGHAWIEACEGEALASADQVVCVSRYTADRVAERYGVGRNRLHVIHNGVEPVPAALPRRTHPGRPTILFLGRVTFQKGPRHFLEVAAHLSERLPQARFLLVGNGDLLAEMVELAADSGLARKLFFPGFLQGEELEKVFALADVLVLPSVSEPFGLTPLEALQRGVPVVLSRRCGVAEALPHCLLADPGNSADMAEKILAVLQRPGLRRFLLREGRRSLKKLTWDRAAGQWMELYQRILNGHGGDACREAPEPYPMSPS